MVNYNYEEEEEEGGWVTRGIEHGYRNTHFSIICRATINFLSLVRARPMKNNGLVKLIYQSCVECPGQNNEFSVATGTVKYECALTGC